MSTATIDAQTLRSPDRTGADDDVDHAVCCDDDVAMCGLYVPTDQYPWNPPDTETTCPLCRWVEDEGLPCTSPYCPGREQ